MIYKGALEGIDGMFDRRGVGEGGSKSGSSSRERGELGPSSRAANLELLLVGGSTSCTYTQKGKH
jgi:hypothetical protein